MEVKGIRWVGVETPALADMRTFMTGVLGLHVAGHDGDDVVELATADGTRVELFAQDGPVQPPWLFDAGPVVAGLLVDDIEAARAELARTPGVELLGDLTVLPDGQAWQHFRAPDGRVFEIKAEGHAG